ncbi:MAG: TlpA family protein disulfide reductase [Anaerolineales bacterium]|nr:TlpA family protein disulfide reductase [Anaerolineales bacterium]
MEQTLSQPKQSTAGRNILLVVGILLLLGLMAIMAINLQKVESVDLKDRKAPDFSLPLFDQFEQDQLALADLRGQVVVVNFWASWCVECYKEAALLEQAWQDYKDRGVMFVGVDYLDTDKEGLAYMAKYGITYPSGPDLGSKISKNYAITGVPETFFIDQEGNIVHVQIGPIERDQLYGLLDRLVIQPAQGS